MQEGSEVTQAIKLDVRMVQSALEYAAKNNNNSRALVKFLLESIGWVRNQMNMYPDNMSSWCLNTMKPLQQFMAYCAEDPTEADKKAMIRHLREISKSLNGIKPKAGPHSDVPVLRGRKRRQVGKTEKLDQVQQVDTVVKATQVEQIEKVTESAPTLKKAHHEQHDQESEEKKLRSPKKRRYLVPISQDPLEEERQEQEEEQRRVEQKSAAEYAIFTKVAGEGNKATTCTLKFHDRMSDDSIDQVQFRGPRWAKNAVNVAPLTYTVKVSMEEINRAIEKKAFVLLVLWNSDKAQPLAKRPAPSFHALDPLVNQCVLSKQQMTNGPPYLDMPKWENVLGCHPLSALGLLSCEDSTDVWNARLLQFYVGIKL